MTDFKGRLIASSANLRLGQKGLKASNTTSYYDMEYIIETFAFMMATK
jgi:hypothetical protein